MNAPQRPGRREPRSTAPASPAADIAASWQRELPHLDTTELLLQIYVMRLGRILDAAYTKLCRTKYGISGPEMRVLFSLRRAGPPFVRRPTDLFRALLVTSGAITKQVDRLQAAGFVVRIPDPSFGGGFLIQLTKKGRNAADDTIETVATQGLISNVRTELSAEEIQTAMMLSERMLTTLERKEPSARTPRQVDSAPRS